MTTMGMPTMHKMHTLVLVLATTATPLTPGISTSGSSTDSEHNRQVSATGRQR
jgi:hypothetical protein